MDARPKVRMIRELAKRHIGNRALRNQLLEVMIVVEEIQGDRNFIAHGVWSTIVARRSGWEGSDNQDEKPGVAA